MDDQADITTSNHYVEAELTQRLGKLSDVFSADILTVVAPMFAGIDNLIRDLVEAIDDGSNNRSDNLCVILETDGGSIEVVERIADVLRHHYSNGEISFIVPDRAMSAGTVLVMCGDNILMDYFSVLGPVDPQVRSQAGQHFVPALGYLDKFKELIDKSANGKLTSAELAFMIDKFDPAELDSFEKARDLSTDLLVAWLKKYKFKDWTTTETRKVKVTDTMKANRAKKIGRALNSTTRWKSHSRGISMQVLQEELDLVIEDFGQDDERREAIRSYYRLLHDYMQRRSKSIVLQNRKTITLL